MVGLNDENENVHVCLWKKQYENVCVSMEETIPTTNVQEAKTLF